MRQAHEQRTRLDVGCESGRLWVEENDKIDVARIIQLKGPHLAHREDEIAGADFRMPGIGGRQLSAQSKTIKQKMHRRTDGAVGQLGHRSGDLFGLPNPADIGERH